MTQSSLYRSTLTKPMMVYMEQNFGHKANIMTCYIKGTQTTYFVLYFVWFFFSVWYSEYLKEISPIRSFAMAYRIAMYTAALEYDC